MPPTTAVSSFGSALQIGDGATPTENFTPITEIGDFDPPGWMVNFDEATNHQSTEAWEEQIPTTRKLDSVNFTVNWNPTNATHLQLLNDSVNSTGAVRRNFKFVPPTPYTAKTIIFAAYVAKFKPSGKVKGRLTLDASLQPTGKPTIA